MFSLSLDSDAPWRMHVPMPVERMGSRAYALPHLQFAPNSRKSKDSSAALLLSSAETKLITELLLFCLQVCHRRWEAHSGCGWRAR